MVELPAFTNFLSGGIMAILQYKTTVRVNLNVPMPPDLCYYPSIKHNPKSPQSRA